MTSAPIALAIWTANVPTPPGIAQRLQGRQPRDRHGGRLWVTDQLRFRGQEARWCCNKLGESAPRDFAEHLVARAKVRDTRTYGNDSTRDVLARNPVSRAREPISGHSHDVGNAREQVDVAPADGGGVDLHQNLVAAGDRPRNGGNPDLLRTAISLRHCGANGSVP